MGACSATLTVLTDGTPTYMNTPETTAADTAPFSIKITWTGIADTDTTSNGRDPIIQYDVQYSENSGDPFQSLAIISSTATLEYTHSKTFPVNQNVQYQICGINLVGQGSCSTPLTVLTDALPLAMNATSTTNADINPSAIILTWSAIPDTDTVNNGRDPIIFYDL